jgi:hypothetical protein
MPSLNNLVVAFDDYLEFERRLVLERFADFAMGTLR